MIKIKLRREWCFLIVAVMVVVVIYVIRASYYESTDDAALESHVIPVSAKVPGHIQKIHVSDNQMVHQGDLLVELDARDFEVRQDRAKAVVLALEAESARTAEDVSRYQKLHTQEEISKQQWDQAKATAQSSEARVMEARANLKQSELEMSYTKIYAPSDGKITHKTIEEGAYVQTGQPLLALISPDLWVVANFKETQISRMSPGQPVEIEIDTYPGKTFNGHIESIQSGSGARFSLFPPENSTGNFVKVVQRVPVKIVFDEPIDSKHPLGPGISVTPTVKVK